VAVPDGQSFDQAEAPARTPPKDAPPARPERAPTARDAVHRCLAPQTRRFPDLGIVSLETEGLDARDSALAHAIYDAVVRRWLTLRCLLETRLSGPLPDLESKLQSVLLAGAAQIFLFDRLPDHAVINESVEWAKRAIRPGAGSMVNAVLRRMVDLRAAGPKRPAWTALRDEIPLADGSALPLTAEVLPEDPMTRWAAATSHPRALLERWSRTYGPDETRRLALHDLVNPPVILNTRHARSPLPSQHLAPHATEGHHLFTGDHADLVSLLASRSDLWVQDPASSAAVLSIQHLRPKLILDICAGQGTKTRQLAAVFPNAKIIATDVDKDRLKVLAAAFAGSDRITVIPIDRLRPAWDAKADLVLLDVPCSNTGVLARRAEARYRSAESLERLAGTQRQIIADALPLFAPKTVILYSTCSLEPEENEAQGVWAKRWHHYRISNARTLLPRGAPGGDPREYTDGSFSCLMETA